MSEATNWHELYTPDVNGSKKFYEGVFGWSSTAYPMGEMGEYTMFGRGDQHHAGIMDTGAEMFQGMDIPPHWLPYFGVDNIDSTLDKIRSSGGKILQDKMEIPDTGFVAICMDPQGAAFALHQPPNK